MLKRLLRAPPVQAVLVRLMAGYLAFCYRTIRWRFVLRGPAGAPCVIAFWHERLPLMTAGWLRLRATEGFHGRQAHVLVSRNHDGRMIGNVLARFGVALVHGSSSRGAVAALRAMAAVLKAGDVIGITPDGPRGPRRVAAPGAAQLAALAQVPLLPCAAAIRRAIVLRSWDRMVLPVPFTRGAIVVGPALAADRRDAAGNTAALAAALDDCAAEADRLAAA
jgi:hypothetical protein